jgi:hypothetical protein
MQESTTIQWNPIPFGRLPWSTRLFIVYLAVVLLLFCFGAVRMLWHLRRLRNFAPEAYQFLPAWNSCHTRMVSMKNWSALTFLLSFLVLAWSMKETLSEISVQKWIGTAFIAATTAEMLMTFCFGMLMCVILYAFAFFCEALLERYKSRQPVPKP